MASLINILFGIDDPRPDVDSSNIMKKLNTERQKVTIQNGSTMGKFYKLINGIREETGMYVDNARSPEEKEKIRKRIYTFLIAVGLIIIWVPLYITVNNFNSSNQINTKQAPKDTTTTVIDTTKTPYTPREHNIFSQNKPLDINDENISIQIEINENLPRNTVASDNNIYKQAIRELWKQFTESEKGKYKKANAKIQEEKGKKKAIWRDIIMTLIKQWDENLAKKIISYLHENSSLKEFIIITDNKDVEVIELKGQENTNTIQKATKKEIKDTISSQPKIQIPEYTIRETPNFKAKVRDIVYNKVIELEANLGKLNKEIFELKKEEKKYSPTGNMTELLEILTKRKKLEQKTKKIANEMANYETVLGLLDSSTETNDEKIAKLVNTLATGDVKNYIKKNLNKN